MSLALFSFLGTLGFASYLSLEHSFFSQRDGSHFALRYCLVQWRKMKHLEIVNFAFWTWWVLYVMDNVKFLKFPCDFLGFKFRAAVYSWGQLEFWKLKLPAVSLNSFFTDFFFCIHLFHEARTFTSEMRNWTTQNLTMNVWETPSLKEWLDSKIFITISLLIAL